MSAADELAMIRSRIARLKAREAALTDTLIAAPEDRRTGRWARAEVAQTVMRVFDHRLLPDTQRDDPRYWRERVLTQVRCLPLTAREPASWTPPRREGGRAGDAAAEAREQRGAGIG